MSKYIPLRPVLISEQVYVGQQTIWPDPYDYNKMITVEAVVTDGESDEEGPSLWWCEVRGE